MMETDAQSERCATAWPACCTKSRLQASTARASTTTGPLYTNTGKNLLTPGRHPESNPVFLADAVRRASGRWTSTRTCCAWRAACPGNDERLGGHEAPPAIVSVFLGDELTDMLQRNCRGRTACKLRNAARCWQMCAACRR